jgi:hypothetical protein
MTTSQYLKTIRNAEKRRYAEAYLAHVTTGAADPDVRRFNIRNWSPQDVRIQIDSTLEGVN